MNDIIFFLNVRNKLVVLFIKYQKHLLDVLKHFAINFRDLKIESQIVFSMIYLYLDLYLKIKNYFFKYFNINFLLVGKI